MSTTVPNSGYPDFVTDADRHCWDALTPEVRKQYLDAAEYIRVEYPGEEPSMVDIGTVLTFGG